MRVKVCGFTRSGDVAAAVAAGADALGFIVDVTVDTPREVDAGRASDLVSEVPPFVSTVLVTMATDPERVAGLVGRTGVDVVQVHADLPPESLHAVREEAGVRVVKVVDAADPGAARRHEDAADALLVDSTDAAGGGGTGDTHDWERTADLVATLDAPWVDVATGVERTGGVKDHEAVEAFVAGAKREVTRA